VKEIERLGEELAAKRKHLHEFYAEKDSGNKMSADDVVTFQQGTKEVSDLQKKYNDLKAAEDWVMQSKGELDAYNRVSPTAGHGTGAGPVSEPAIKTLGDLFTESNAYKAYRSNGLSYKNISVDLNTQGFGSTYVETKNASGQIELKIMGTTNSLTGFVPKNVRSDTVINGPLQRPMVGDIIPSYNTQQGITKWMKESTTTNNAAAQAEGGAAVTESVLVWTETTAPLEKVSSWISVTQEQLDDVDNIKSLINERLTYMHAVKEDYYLLNGTGSTPQIVGLNASAMTGEQTQAAGTDAVFDAIMKAIVKVQTGATSLGLANPTNVIMNPANYQTVVLTTTADGIYLYGNPSAAPAQPTLWGLPVTLTTNQTANTAIVGDFRNGVRLARRQGLTLDMTDSHASNFTINVMVLKVTSRLALEHYIPAGFCFVTGLT
jgi:HK97 family phage major capsid protein